MDLLAIFIGTEIRTTQTFSCKLKIFYIMFQESNLTFFSTFKNLLVTIFSTSKINFVLAIFQPIATQSHVLTTLKWEMYENFVAKREIAYDEQFSFPQSVFYIIR